MHLDFWKQRVGLNLSLRLTLWYSLFFIVAILIIFAMTYFLLSGYVRNHEADVLETRIQEYRAWLAEGGIPALKARFDEQRNQQQDSFFVRVVAPGTQSIFFNTGKGTPPITVDVIQKLSTRNGVIDLTMGDGKNLNRWTIMTRDFNQNIILQVGKNSNAPLMILAELKSIFFRAMLPLVILALGGGGIITYITMRPLRDLNATLHKLLEQNSLEERVPVRSSDPELNQLTALFNRLLEVNSKLISAMRESLDNAAHDLRTPLTRLRNAAEQALERGKTPEELREGLADCLEESDHVLKMLEVTLDVAEAKSGMLKLNKIPVDILDSCRRIVELYEIAAEEKRIRLDIREKSSATVLADPIRLEQVIGNLMDNALKYSPPDTTIILEISSTDKRGILQVIDQGMGIPEEDLPRIWDRLYRGDCSRSQRGLGLGLSLVQAVIHAHGGNVEVSSKVNQGSVFTLRLPLAASIQDEGKIFST